MLLRYALQAEEEAVAVERAIEAALGAGCRTADLVATTGLSPISGSEMATAIVQRVRAGSTASGNSL